MEALQTESLKMKLAPCRQGGTEDQSRTCLCLTNCGAVRLAFAYAAQVKANKKLVEKAI